MTYCASQEESKGVDDPRSDPRTGQQRTHPSSLRTHKCYAPKTSQRSFLASHGLASWSLSDDTLLHATTHTHNTTLPTLTPNALINLPALSIRHSPLVAPHTVHQISSSPYQHSGTRPPFIQSVSPSLPLLTSARPLHSFHPPTLTQHSCPPSTSRVTPPIYLGTSISGASPRRNQPPQHTPESPGFINHPLHLSNRPWTHPASPRRACRDTTPSLPSRPSAHCARTRPWPSRAGKVGHRPRRARRPAQPTRPRDRGASRRWTCRAATAGCGAR